MGVEIERKFLVDGDGWREDVTQSLEIVQGYVRSPDASIRVRIQEDEGILTFKGETVGVTRSEWQWPIPADDARELIEAFCGDHTLRKVRHLVPVGDHVWEVDEFGGRFAGLVVAEVELESEDESFERPDWAGREVSDDPRYFNEVLANERTPP